jgi:hypothetical protein
MRTIEQHARALTAGATTSRCTVLGVCPRIIPGRCARSVGGDNRPAHGGRRVRAGSRRQGGRADFLGPGVYHATGRTEHRSRGHRPIPANQSSCHRARSEHVKYITGGPDWDRIRWANVLAKPSAALAIARAADRRLEWIVNLSRRSVPFA